LILPEVEIKTKLLRELSMRELCPLILSLNSVTWDRRYRPKLPNETFELSFWRLRQSIDARHERAVLPMTRLRHRKKAAKSDCLKIRKKMKSSSSDEKF
jgi:hypothetical protein